MQLTNQEIIEFQVMCQEHLGLELSTTDAHDQAIKLLRVIQITYKPMTLEEYEAIRPDNKDKDEPGRPEAL